MNPITYPIVLSVPALMVGVGVLEWTELPQSDVPGWQAPAALGEQALSRQQAESLAAYRDDVVNRFRPVGNPLRPVAAPYYSITGGIQNGVSSDFFHQWRFYYDGTNLYVYANIGTCTPLVQTGCIRPDATYYASILAAGSNPAQIQSPFVGTVNAARLIVNPSFSSGAVTIPAAVPGVQNGTLMWVTLHPTT